MIESGFWFLLGFFVASWLAYRARERTAAKAAQSFQVAKTEVLRILDAVRDITQIRVTIIDRDGELELETEEDPPAETSSRRRRGLH